MPSRGKRAIDQAKEWRERAFTDWAAKVANEPIPGITKYPNIRYVYLRLRVGESAGQQLKTVIKLWGQGQPELGGVMSAGWAAILPSGEMFCPISVSKYAMYDWQTNEKKVPVVDASELLLKELAKQVGWMSATIEGGDVFVCEDGRRFPLALCVCRRLTDDDYNAHVRRPKKTGPKQDTRDRANPAAE